MKVFQCGHCGHPLFFENFECENCGHYSGYRDGDQMMLTFDPQHANLISDRETLGYKYCKNHESEVCNWVLRADDPNQYCRACQLNRTIPNLSDEGNYEKWQHLEVAKHRLVYQLQKLGLSLPSKMTDPENGLCFDFVSRKGNPDLMTGHANGVITILLMEADAAIREQMRKELAEPYRTLIGHLRHEVGHYFWEQLIQKNDVALQQFRSTFGDEQMSYSNALHQYYQNGAPEGWEEDFISKYATSHPWEDWAETWAHYLHIMDMVETAHFFGLRVDPSGVLQDMKADITFDPYTLSDFHEVIKACVPLSFAVNSINRAMGVPDVYPFEITDGVVRKMKFIHDVVCVHVNTSR